MCPIVGSHIVSVTVFFPMYHTIGKTAGPLKQFNDFVMIPKNPAIKSHIHPPNNFGRYI